MHWKHSINAEKKERNFSLNLSYLIFILYEHFIVYKLTFKKSLEIENHSKMCAGKC